jgi:AraC-like DNA-binding protein
MVSASGARGRVLRAGVGAGTRERRGGDGCDVLGVDERLGAVTGGRRDHAVDGLQERLAEVLHNDPLHGDAAQPWTVPELAAVSGLSRAAFARSSPYAFAAAFRRRHGRPPGQWRQRELHRPDIDQPARADGIHAS